VKELASRFNLLPPLVRASHSEDEVVRNAAAAALATLAADGARCFPPTLLFE